MRDDDKTLTHARQAVIEVLSPAVMVDAAGVASNFERMVRIADATGIQLDKAISGKYSPHCLPPAGGGWRGAQRGQCSLASPRPLDFPPPRLPPLGGGMPCCTREVLFRKSPHESGSMPCVAVPPHGAEAWVSRT